MPHQPSLNAEHAGVLLEVMRDLLYQTFVRKGSARASESWGEDGGWCGYSATLGCF